MISGIQAGILFVKHMQPDSRNGQEFVRSAGGMCMSR